MATVERVRASECLPCRRRGFKGIPVAKVFIDEPWCQLCINGGIRKREVKSLTVVKKDKFTEDLTQKLMRWNRTMKEAMRYRRVVIKRWAMELRAEAV